MADITTIAKAKAYALAIKNLVGVQPNIEAGPIEVRLYYPDNVSEQAKKAWRDFFKQPKGSNIKIDIAREALPGLVESYLLYGLLGVGLVWALARK